MWTDVSCTNNMGSWEKMSGSVWNINSSARTAAAEKTRQHLQKKWKIQKKPHTDGDVDEEGATGVCGGSVVAGWCLEWNWKSSRGTN